MRETHLSAADVAARRPVTWPGPIGGCSLVTMMGLGAWLEYVRWSQGSPDLWFFAALTLSFLLGLGALATQGRLHTWAIRAAAYLFALPPVALFAATVVRATAGG